MCDKCIPHSPTPLDRANRDMSRELFKPKPRKRRARLTRKEKDSIMAELGLVKVRGALGGVYYE